MVVVDAVAVVVVVVGVVVVVDVGGAAVRAVVVVVVVVGERSAVVEAVVAIASMTHNESSSEHTVRNFVEHADGVAQPAAFNNCVHVVTHKGLRPLPTQLWQPCEHTSCWNARIHGALTRSAAKQAPSMPPFGTSLTFVQLVTF